MTGPRYTIFIIQSFLFFFIFDKQVHSNLFEYWNHKHGLIALLSELFIYLFYKDRNSILA